MASARQCGFLFFLSAPFLWSVVFAPRGCVFVSWLLLFVSVWPSIPLRFGSSSALTFCVCALRVLVRVAGPARSRSVLSALPGVVVVVPVARWRVMCQLCMPVPWLWCFGLVLLGGCCVVCPLG